MSSGSSRGPGDAGRQRRRAVFFVPLASGDVSGDFNFEGQPPPPAGREAYAGYRIVSGDYFAAMGVPLRQGRLLGARGPGGAPLVAVVNEAFARRFVPGGSPLGKRITFGDGTEDAVYREIVGVVADVRHQGLTVDPAPEIYVPFVQVPADLWSVFATIPLSVVVRSAAPVESRRPRAPGGGARGGSGTGRLPASPRR